MIRGGKSEFKRGDDDGGDDIAQTKDEEDGDLKGEWM